MNKLTLLLLKLNALMAFAAEMALDPTHPINTSKTYRQEHRAQVGRMYTALLKGLRETDNKGNLAWPDPDWAPAPLARDFFLQHERRDLVAGGYLAARCK